MNRTELLAFVKHVIDTCDPMGLLRMGCPADEYDPEVREIAERIAAFDGEPAVADCVAIVDQVFEKWFVKITIAPCVGDEFAKRFPR